jgi:hypothetical protein
MYSTNDEYGLILSVKDGKLQLMYHLSENQSTILIFNDDRLINNAEEYSIIISYQPVPTILSPNTIEIPIPSSLSLVFNLIIVGGSHDITSKNQFIGCFSNIQYNYRPLLPDGSVKTARYDCFYDPNFLCNRQVSCSLNESFSFCGQSDCSLVCIPPTNTPYNQSLLRYSSTIHSGENEQIHLTIFTTSGNSTLFQTNNGSIQVSIILQVNSTMITKMKIFLF